MTKRLKGGISLFDSIIKKRPLVSRCSCNTPPEDMSCWFQTIFHSGRFLDLLAVFFKKSYSHLPCIQLLSSAFLHLVYIHDAKKNRKTQWRGWRWSSLLFPKQLTEGFGAGRRIELEAVSQELQVRLVGTLSQSSQATAGLGTGHQRRKSCEPGCFP